MLSHIIGKRISTIEFWQVAGLYRVESKTRFFKDNFQHDNYKILITLN